MFSKKLLLPLLLLLTVWSCDPPRKVATGDDQQIEIVFLQLNDVYEISPLSDGSGGLARVATLRKQLLAKNPNTFTVLSGDFISPSVIGTLKYEGKRIRGRQMVDAMNTLGVDWVVFGNHEFDYDDPKDLQARLDESKFTWLAGNARYKADDKTPAQPFFKNTASGKSACPDDLTVEVKDADGTAVRLGVFGVLINTGRKPYVEYSDWFEAAKRSSESLKSRGSDVVVGLTHLVADDDKKLAAMLPDVPLLMGGHDHDNQIHRVGNAVVAKADANAKTVYVHTLRYDKRTRKTTVKSELVRIDSKIADEPATAAVIAKWEKVKNESLATSGFDPDKKVVTLTQPLDCREGAVRHTQCPVGADISAAMLAAARNQPDCALFNSGSIRVDDVLSGTLTEIDIVRMLPFGGGLTEVVMKGSLLKKTLDTGRSNKGTGGYLQLARIQYNEAKMQWLVNQQPLDEKKTYKVILPDFLLTGNELNMGFLKTESDGKGSSSNPDITSVQKPDAADKTDLRNDIRWALIQYWRK